MPVPGYEMVYEVSNLGCVRSRARTQVPVIKAQWKHDGYWRCKIGSKAVLVHRLVLIAFVGAPEQGMEACHNNGVRTDNKLENLRWDTRSANQMDRRKHGTQNHVNVTHCPQGHSYSGANLILNMKGSRECRICNREKVARYRKRKSTNT